jgi:hypothetical protein
MYVAVFSTDVRWGTIGHTLCKPYSKYTWDHWTDSLQNVQWTYVGPLDIRYFLKCPVVNTWTYEAAFGLLGKNHRTYIRVGRTSIAF